jgi:hypothetical protein
MCMCVSCVVWDQCIPCWPTAKTQKRTMVAKVTGTTEQTKAFSFAEAHTTLLQLNTEVCVPLLLLLLILFYCGRLCT